MLSNLTLFVQCFFYTFIVNVILTSCQIFCCIKENSNLFTQMEAFLFLNVGALVQKMTILLDCYLLLQLKYYLFYFFLNNHCNANNYTLNFIPYIKSIMLSLKQLQTDVYLHHSGFLKEKTQLLHTYFLDNKLEGRYSIYQSQINIYYI